MRLGISNSDDWVVDLDATNCSVSNERRLSKYALEHLATLPTKILFLLLVHNRGSNLVLLKAKALKVEDMQGYACTRIIRREYIRLRCTLGNVKK